MTADLRAGIEALIERYSTQLDPARILPALRALLAAHPVQDEGWIPLGIHFGMPGISTFIPHASVWCTAEGAVTITAIPEPPQVTP